jgi:hypothetical protein
MSFLLEIIQQGWLSEMEDDDCDRCSHGIVRLSVNGTEIAPTDGTIKYNIGASALALLRTLDDDRPPQQQMSSPYLPDATHVIGHCGQGTLSSCPIGIDWHVEHRDGRVLLSHFARCDDCSDAHAVEYSALATDLAFEEYRLIVVKYATEAKSFFVGKKKRMFQPEYDALIFTEFWTEFNKRLTRHGGPAGLVPNGVRLDVIESHGHEEAWAVVL